MEELDELLDDYVLVAVLNDFSPFCFQVKELLESFKLDSSKIRIVQSTATQGNDVERAAATKTRQRSAPYLFVDKLYIGGVKQILALYESGGLEELFIQVGIIQKPDTTILSGLLCKYPVVLVTNSFSPFCLEALGILDTYSIPAEKYMKLQVDKSPDALALEEQARFMAKHTQLPYIFIGGKPIGLVESLQELHEGGELEETLMSCGALPPPNYELLDGLISSETVVIVGDSTSSEWKDTKAILGKYNIADKTHFIATDVRTDGQEIARAARFATKTRKSPYVFIGREYFGSHNKVIQLDAAGGLSF